MKKFLSRFSVFILVLSMTLGLGSTTALAYSEEEVAQVTEYYFQIWNEMDFQQYLDAGVITDEAALEQYTRWQELKNQIGAYEEAVETRVEEEEDGIVVTLVEKYTNSEIHFTMSFDKTLVEEDPFSAILTMDATLPVSNAGEASMAKAGMNTLMGMGIVFLALIFISMIIWLLKFIPVFFERRKQKEQAELPASAPVPVAQAKEADDTELAAVITAAIMALRAEENGGMADSGFVVRSIRRRHS